MSALPVNDGIITRSERYVLKGKGGLLRTLIDLFENGIPIPQSPKQPPCCGIPQTPKQPDCFGISKRKPSSLLEKYDGLVDRFVDSQASRRKGILKLLFKAPSDYVTVSKDGLTIGPERNAIGKFKDKVIDFLF